MAIERRRMVIAESPAAWLRTALQKLPVREASVTFAIAMRSRTIGLKHSDPGDRFIGATAVELGIPLLTSDPLLRACKEIRCL